MADTERTPLLEGEEEDHSLLGRISNAVNSPASLNSLEKFLALVAIGLLLISGLSLGLLGGLSAVHGDERSRPRPTATTTTTRTRTHTVLGPTVTSFPNPRKNKDVCVTASCVSAAARVLAALDEQVDPCEDFYGFANNGWLRANPIPDAKAIWGVGEQVDQQNKRLLQSILADAPSSTLPAADQRNLNTLRTFYGSCMADDMLAKEGDKPLVDMVKHLVSLWRGKSGENGFMVQSGNGRWDPETRRERLTSALLFLHSQGVPALFDFYLEGDVKFAPKTLVLWLQQAGLSFPKDYYSDDSALEKLESVVENTLRSLYTDGLHERADVSELAKSVVLFETRLANASLSEIDMSDPEGTYNKFNSTALRTLFPSISIGDYFAGYSPRSYPDPVIVTSSAYVEKLVKILSDEEDDVLESYFVFRMAQSLGPLLTSQSEIYQQVQGLQNYLTGVVTKPVRSEVCLQSLLDSFGFLVGRYFVEEAFSAEAKDYAEEVIVAIIKSFKTKLPTISFLDDESRAGAVEKANALKYKIGYPSYPNTTDAEAMERYYAISPTTDSYFGNVVTSRVADGKRLWSQVNQERNPATWEMIPSEVNAYYNPSTNEVVFPAGILQPPYYSASWPEYLAFGSFGSVAGHELSHAFDTTGRQYDQNGKLANWWTNATVSRFEELTDCFVQQYAKYFIIGPDGKKHFVQSRLTLGEDGSDSGGLSQAFGAWKERFEGDRKMKRYKNYQLPGLAHYSREQLFFIAFSQGWARQATPAEALRRIRIDPHSPTEFRVQGALSNSEEFATAFGCKAGSRMSNVDKCKIW